MCIQSRQNEGTKSEWQSVIVYSLGFVCKFTWWYAEF